MYAQELPEPGKPEHVLRMVTEGDRDRGETGGWVLSTFGWRIGV